MKGYTKTFIAASAIAIIGGIAINGASEAKRGMDGYGHGGPGGRAVAMLIEYDVDQDGKLTQVEIDGAREANLAKFDADKDGKLSLEEYQVLWLDFMRERMVDRFQALDADGDALVTVEEFRAPMAYIVVRADRNGDGSLSFDDMPRGHKGGHDKKFDDDKKDESKDD